MDTVRDPMRDERILALDQDPAALQKLERTLKLSGHNAWFVQSARQAVRAFERAPTDLLIAGVRLPRAGCLDAVRHVRPDHANAGRVLIASPEHSQCCVDAVRTRAADYLRINRERRAECARPSRKVEPRVARNTNHVVIK